MKIATVCSGIGSPEVALKNLGINHSITFACEIDKYARETYLANHNPEMMYHDMTAESWEGEKYYADLMIGGIPCQSFSLAGKRLGELDPRGLLFFDFLRYVKNQNPKYFIIENVKGLLSMDDGEVFRNWIQLLGQSENGNTFMFPHEDSLMYNLHWQVLNTKDYGLPQNRERVFLIGIRNDLPNDFNFPKTIPLKLRLKDILEDEVDEKYYLSEKMINYLTTRKDNFNNGKINFKGENDIASCINASSKSLDISDNIIQVGNVNPSGNGMNGNVFSDEGLCPTLTTNKGEGVKVMIGAMRGRTVKIAKVGRSEEGKKQRKESLAKGVDYTPFQAKEIKFEESDVMNCITTATTKDNLIQVSEYQQDLEINENGTSNCLTSVQKDNLVVQINPSLESGGKQPYQQNRVCDGKGIAPSLCRGKNDLNVTEIIQLNNPTHSNDRIYSDEGISPTLNTMQGGNRQPFIENNFRIRKLTVRECARLQGFPEAFDLSKVSNSQGYKQMGNTISVNVIQAILKNLLK